MANKLITYIKESEFELLLKAEKKERRKHKLPVAIEDTELLKIMKVARHKHQPKHLYSSIQ